MSSLWLCGESTSIFFSLPFSWNASAQVHIEKIGLKDAAEYNGSGYIDPFHSGQELFDKQKWL